MKKNYLFSLAFLALAWMTGFSARAWDEPAQVDGVYQIGTASELEWFAEYVNSVTGNDDPDKDAKLTAQAVLTANIDMAGIDHSPLLLVVIQTRVERLSIPTSFLVNLMVSFTQSVT